MRLHLIAGATVVASAVLAACSGTAGFVPPPPTPPPSPPPAYHYAGKMTQTYTYLYGYPSPEPPSTTTTTVKDVVVVSPTAGPGLPSGTNDVHVDEIDTTPLQTSRTVTDAYVSTHSAQTLLYGSVAELKAAQGGQSSHTTTTYATPQILSRQHGTWTNSPASSIDEKYSDGHYQNRTIAANGTYDEKGSAFALNGKMVGTKIVEKATGAGNYTGPFVGCPPPTSWVFTAAPNISVQLVSSSPSCQIGSTSIPDWYPTAPTLYTEHDRVSSGVAMPPSCGSSQGKRARLTERSIERLDTIIGYTERTDVSVFGPLSGPPVCIVLADEIDNYYDWQGDQIAFFTFTDNGKPVSTIVTDESLAASSPSGGASAAGADAIVAGAQAHFAAKLDAIRARLRDAMIRRFLTVPNSTGGVR